MAVILKRRFKVRGDFNTSGVKMSVYSTGRQLLNHFEWPIYNSKIKINLVFNLPL